MAWLPERPFRLKERFASATQLKAGVVMALMVALGVLLTGYGASQWRDRLAERAVWATGSEAADAGAQGRVESHSILGLVTLFYEYDLEVTFRDASGAHRQVKYEAVSLLEEADTDADLVVRHDPRDPGRIALSWTAELAYGTWLWALVVTVLGPVVAAGGWKVLSAARRAVRSARACAVRSDEIEAKVLGLDKVKGRYGVDTKKWRLTYELPPTPRSRGGRREVVLDGEPILVTAVEGIQRAVALVSPEAPDHPTFPLRNLHPFEATPEQIRDLEARLGAAAAAPAGQPRA